MLTLALVNSTVYSDMRLYGSIVIALLRRNGIRNILDQRQSINDSSQQHPIISYRRIVFLAMCMS